MNVFSDADLKYFCHNDNTTETLEEGHLTGICSSLLILGLVLVSALCWRRTQRETVYKGDWQSSDNTPALATLSTDQWVSWSWNNISLLSHQHQSHQMWDWSNFVHIWWGCGPQDSWIRRIYAKRKFSHFSTNLTTIWKLINSPITLLFKISRISESFLHHPGNSEWPMFPSLCSSWVQYLLESDWITNLAGACLGNVSVAAGAVCLIDCNTFILTHTTHIPSCQHFQ